MQFLNDTVDIDLLPKAEEVSFTTLEKEYLKVLKLEWMIVSVILLTVIAILIYFIPFFHSFFWIGLIGTLYLLFSSLFYIFRTRSFRYMAYAVRERDIVYRTGWIIRKTHTCPFNRIQNSSISAGPLERRYHLSTLVLYTAGSYGSDLHIRGLNESVAHTIKDWISKKIDNEPRPEA